MAAGAPPVLGHLFNCTSGPEASIEVNVPGEDFFPLLFTFQYQCHIFIPNCKLWLLKSRCPVVHTLKHQLHGTPQGALFPHVLSHFFALDDPT